jgi:hypothetical protein
MSENDKAIAIHQRERERERGGGGSIACSQTDTRATHVQHWTPRFERAHLKQFKKI